MTPAAYVLPPDHALSRVRRVAWPLGAASLAICLLAALFNPAAGLQAYLIAYVFWIGAALGSLAILMIQHLTGGTWGAAIRRFLEAGAGTLPVMALAFLPIAAGLPVLYVWADAASVARDPLLQHKHLYLNAPFFLARTAGYFVAWVLAARALRRWSLLQDATDDPTPERRMELISRGGLLLLGLTMTFAAIDWMMSLDPHWFSTIYGVLFMAGSALTALALMIVLGTIAGVLTPAVLQDLGSLLLAFVMLWAYFAFSQFLIIWSANLPEEIPFYLERGTGGWRWLALVVVVFHFAVPFVVLLSRAIKRDARRLALVALGLVVMRMADVFWLIRPSFHPVGLAVHWLDPLAMVGLGGIWLATFVRELDGVSLLPLRDPALPLEHI